MDKSLFAILDHRMRTGNPVPVPLALAILRQLCEALDYVHNLRDEGGRPRWLLHRDVSPANVLVTIGNARLVPSATPHASPAYLAPEFLAVGMFDPRAEIFALGTIAHEMLANRPLFASPSYDETIHRIFQLAIPPPSSINPQVPAELDGIVLMALGRDPMFRWQSAAMMRDGVISVAERLGLASVAPDAWARLLSTDVTSPEPPRHEAEPVKITFGSSRQRFDTNAETQLATPILPRQTTEPATTPAPAVPAASSNFEPAAPPAAPAPNIEPAASSNLEPAELEPAAPSKLEPSAPSKLELELGEFTQIGAVPLIAESSDASLVALVGEPRRASKASVPPPLMGVSLPDVEEPKKPRGKLYVVISIVILVAIVLAVIFDI